MPPKSTQALEEAITTLSERLLKLHASMELRHDSLVTMVFDIQQYVVAVPAPVASFPSPSALPPLLPPIPASQRLDVISFYTKGEALSWFKWMFTNRQLSSWEAFVRALELRFGPSSFDNHHAVLFKLRSRAHRHRRTPRLCCLPRYRRLSPTDLQEQRAKGLCFNCDEKFGPGHLCKAKQFMLLLSDNPPDLFNTCLDPKDSPSSPAAALTDGVLFQLSPVAVSGSTSPHTVCLRSLIRRHVVSVLIDSGSSHNIIQPRVAAFLSLAKLPLPSFPVLVGNDAALHCSEVCRDVPLMLQSHKFSISVYVIQIFGADIVLGVQWLSSLGTFISDFSVPSMQFSHVTVLDRFPIPIVDELLDEFHGTSIFSKLDLRAWYHQIRVAPEDAYKTAFRTVDGHFEFLVMPFGLSNAPSTFQSAIANWPPPRSITGLRAFLDLTGYYRRFVQHYAAIAGPLTDLLKGRQLQWSPAASAAFTALKMAMVHLPVLNLSDFTLPFDVTTDESQVVTGAVLSQN
ncbi:UNVERIFIED_CONTAM: Retrovirus-related Pol polyprotein from transposon.6 [Sesamum angustifolium]|uniref:Retrovirus-related Pol polyprotein from transposon.6 n=1 Tax=Sesamum angustifolium TaxID=2727405 RepID=A0AAW2IND2_9LAMI